MMKNMIQKQKYTRFTIYLLAALLLGVGSIGAQSHPALAMTSMNYSIPHSSFDVRGADFSSTTDHQTLRSGLVGGEDSEARADDETGSSSLWQDPWIIGFIILALIILFLLVFLPLLGKRRK